jgi:exodeoxyribonuclease V alpha subunit
MGLGRGGVAGAAERCHAAAISAGEWITATGSWVNDRTQGQQFEARFLKTSVPTSVEGIEK